MLVLANEMFNYPPVFAWVLPVFVRLQPGKEETFSPASRSRIFVFSTSVVESRHTTMLKGGVGSTYADPGRPKSFQPTQQDRQRTGNIAEYFLQAEKTTNR
jgi:hypothetical protein